MEAPQAKRSPKNKRTTMLAPAPKEEEASGEASQAKQFAKNKRTTMVWSAATRKNLSPEVLRAEEEAAEKEAEEEELGMVSKLEEEVSESKLAKTWGGMSGLWLVRSTMPQEWERPMSVRGFTLLPRSKETGLSVLERHGISAICTKGNKSEGDMTVGQDNFCSARLPGGFRLHCVADGHGSEGHWVSDRVVRCLPYFMCSQECRKLLREDRVEEAIKLAFEQMQKDLVKAAGDAGVNVKLSGTTAVCILRNINYPEVWVANCGDSRAVLLQRDGSVTFTTHDHNPSRKDERRRVEALGCEVTEAEAGNGQILQKIVQKGKNGQVPQIGFTRSLGDVMYKSFGVTAEPEVFKVKDLGDGNGYFFLASDGVFEFLSNEQVGKAVSSSLSEGKSVQDALERILNLSRKEWQEQEDDYCDDITAMLIPVKQVTGKPPVPDEGCFGGVTFGSEQCRGRIDRLCSIQ
eukprot:TRINITY_DN37300_c0_g1_i1.p1 TRINITY_DN37300_c0_g1~~TRINITY_DN37300_c0_g1_i1.p1  ORF type:complete len:462 (-),score=118.59 TRINITY_DN37300_c0_g1_i1:33-1418(-)